LKVSINRFNGALNVCALEGLHKGKLIARVEEIALKDAEFSDQTRVTGTVEALWGAELPDDLDNDTLRGLAFGKAFRPIQGDLVRYDDHGNALCASNSRPITKAARVRLNGNRVVASGIS
jgi:hypothetical protein